MASDSSMATASGAPTRKNARRVAVFSPIPGSRRRAPTSRSMGGDVRTGSLAGAGEGGVRDAQAGSGPQHIKAAIRTLKAFEFEERNRNTLIVKEPVGVVGMITPWNWPLNQIACKVAPALAAGCTMVLKPSEVAPLNAILFAEILDEAPRDAADALKIG